MAMASTVNPPPLRINAFSRAFKPIGGLQMRKKTHYYHTLSAIFVLAMFAHSESGFAKTINLYDQPKEDSKIVGNIDLAVGLINIYVPKEGGWVKVGDPRNGNVGWVKTGELGNTPLTYNVTNSKDGVNSYHIIQYGNSKPYTPEQVKAAMAQMQKREQALERDMQLMMHDMFADMHGWMHMPMFMPVLVVPEKSLQPAPSSAKAPAATTTPTPPSTPTPH